MKIEALEDLATPSHTLKKGDVVDMRSADALVLLDAKKVKEFKPKKATKKKGA